MIDQWMEWVSQNFQTNIIYPYQLQQNSALQSIPAVLIHSNSWLLQCVRVQRGQGTLKKVWKKIQGEVRSKLLEKKKKKKTSTSINIHQLYVNFSPWTSINYIDNHSWHGENRRNGSPSGLWSRFDEAQQLRVTVSHSQSSDVCCFRFTLILSNTTVYYSYIMILPRILKYIEILPFYPPVRPEFKQLWSTSPSKSLQNLSVWSPWNITIGGVP